jgi:transposase
MTIMIGIGSHKGSHTAVAIDSNETVLGEVRVRSCSRQTTRPCDWAGRFGERPWAVESAQGLGDLLAQQLVAADETPIVKSVGELADDLPLNSQATSASISSLA